MENIESPFASFATNDRPVEYAGFWLRAVAVIIDFSLLWMVNIFLRLILSVFVLDFTSLSQAFALKLSGITFFMSWLYFALMESSKYQATIGKILLHLKVTDLDGNRIGFGRASGRYFAKILSGLFFGIGFMIAGRNRKKQALHDGIASTLVIKSKAGDLNIITEGY